MYIMEIDMETNENTDNYPSYAEEQAWQDEQMDLFYEYLNELKNNCRPPKPYIEPKNLADIEVWFRIN